MIAAPADRCRLGRAAAGVPGGSIPLLVMVLVMVGIPGEGIALILGVDRILDMMRTAVNVTGDLTCASFVARSEGEELVPRPKNHDIRLGPPVGNA